MKKFNINHSMYIQITEDGWEYLNKTVGLDYIEHCIEPYKLIIGGDAWYKLQCHQAFHLLPPQFGGKLLFYTNVMFDKSDLEKVKA